MNWPVVVKIAASVAGMILLAISTVYTAHPSAPVMAYVAAASSGIGAYLLGLYQESPAAK